MTKKEYIQAFIDKVKDIWEPARGFAVLLRYDILSDEQVDRLFEVFKEVVNTTLHSQNKYKLQKAMQKVSDLNLHIDPQQLDHFSQDIDQILTEI